MNTLISANLFSRSHAFCSSRIFSSFSFSLIYSAVSLILAGKLKLAISTISSFGTFVALISKFLNFSYCFYSSDCLTSSLIFFGTLAIASSKSASLVWAVLDACVLLFYSGLPSLPALAPPKSPSSRDAFMTRRSRTRLR